MSFSSSQSVSISESRKTVNGSGFAYVYDWYIFNNKTCQITVDGNLINAKFSESGNSGISMNEPILVPFSSSINFNASGTLCYIKALVVYF